MTYLEARRQGLTEEQERFIADTWTTSNMEGRDRYTRLQYVVKWFMVKWPDISRKFVYMVADANTQFHVCEHPEFGYRHIGIHNFGKRLDKAYVG